MATVKTSRMSPEKTRRAAKARRRDKSILKPEYLAVIDNYRLMDDDFMSKCLENAPECIELMLHIILGKKDLKVVKSQTEYPIKSLQGRGVRFDIFARDSKGKEYDIEIQRANKGAEPQRARYNSALMDANMLKRGEDVDKLRETYVIFITENDVLGGGKEVYRIDRMIRELEGTPFGDGTHIIYVNAASRSNSEIGKLVHDLCCRNSDEMNFEVLKNKVNQFKKSEEWRYDMCEAMQRIEALGMAKGMAKGEAKGRAEGKAEGKAEGRAEGRAEGEAKGKRENMLETARRMLESGMLALKDIARFSGLSLAQVKKLQLEMA